ncbi:unnamed protein product [Caretta caretta]
MVMASLCVERPGPAYWHFNNSLLEDVGFLASFREFWLAWRGQRRTFPSVWRWWDVGKVRAQLFCHDYTRGASRRKDAAIEQLEREVLELERRLAASPEDPSLCWEKQEELQDLEDHRARDDFVRSRIGLLQKMDRGSRFFYALEKRKGTKKHITCLLAEDGTLFTDLAEILLWDGLLMVGVGDRDWLELSLTLAKFSEALSLMPTNKSLGTDGLTV